MVTKADLLNDARQQQLEAKRAEEQSQLEHNQWKRKRLADDTLRVKGLLEGELGEFLLKLNRAGHKAVWVEQYKTWEDKAGNRSREHYGNPFSLDFSPDPKYRPTQLLVRLLKSAGFDVQKVTEMHRNVEYRTTADGYETIDVPGEHPVHYLRISWE